MYNTLTSPKDFKLSYKTDYYEKDEIFLRQIWYGKPAQNQIPTLEVRSNTLC